VDDVGSGDVRDAEPREPLSPGVGTPLGRLALPEVTIVSESDSLATVAAAFERDGSSCALLAEGPLRVVTERDMTLAWAQNRLADDPCASVATEHPYWVASTTSVGQAAPMMLDLGIRHLIVVDSGGVPCAVVSMPELLAILVQAQEPSALYASFAAVLLRPGRSEPPGTRR
jgi:signal-transduction protein with cAMP-binding, CBS, and nucleotidyltransferase domain